MNWKLIFELSLFGLAMGIATVFMIPSNVEPVFWLAIFLFCAFIIARRVADRQFLHGLMVGVVNSVWITATHLVLFNQYIAHHQREAEMMKSITIPPRLMMAVTGPIIGVISGIVLGALAFIASRIVRRRPAQVA